MAVNARQIRGALAFWQAHRKRLINAFGNNVVQYFNDFVSGIHNTGEADLDWTVTRVEGGAGESTFAIVDGVGGIVRITTDAAENDGINAQAIGEAWELTADQDLYFGAFGVQMSNATQSDLFLGLAITDTDILGGVTDRIGFEKLDGSTDLKFMLEKDSTETLSAALATIVAATPIDLEFYWNGSTIEVFINGVLVATPVVTNLPNDEALRISWQFLAGDANARTCDIDLIRCIMIGR